MPPDQQPLADKRFLIVEDEMLIAMLLERIVVEAGAAPPRTMATVATALDALATDRFDAVILDVSLGKQPGTAVAEAGIAQGLPVLLSSGDSSAALFPSKLQNCRCSKNHMTRAARSRP